MLLGLSLAACGGPGKFSDEPAPLDTSNPAQPPSVATEPLAPVGISIPAIGLNNRDFMQVGLTSRKKLEVPPLSMPKTIGWYRSSRVPGDPPPPGCTFESDCVSSAILGAHVNANGVPGAFAKLALVKVGALVEVERADNKLAVFKITKVQILLKKAFPTKQVYGTVTKPELRLLTCGPGELETLPDGSRSYKNQTIIYASLVELKSA